MISKNQIKFIRQLETKKFRSRESLFVAEGPKVVGDLLRRYKAKAIYATDEWNPADSISVSSVERITDEELRRISFLQHPQQVLALFPIPKTDSSSVVSHLTSSLSLALDGIQDPGNLGTIIRIADWFGIDTIYCSEDTAVQSEGGPSHYGQSRARKHILYKIRVSVRRSARGFSCLWYTSRR